MHSITLPARAAALALALTACCASALAQGYPAKPVRIVVPYATGGGSDILARQIAAGLQAAWGQGVVVENRAGASGNIGTVEVVRAPADGYTLVLQNSTMVTNLGVSGKLPFDVENDLTPILLLGVTPIALAAHPEAKIGNVKELVAAAKDKSLSYGSCGSGTPQHFAMELLKQKTGIAAQHAGYKGCSPAMTDVLGNHVPLAIVSANLVAPHAKSGKLKVIGVTSASATACCPTRRPSRNRASSLSTSRSGTRSWARRSCRPMSSHALTSRRGSGCSPIRKCAAISRWPASSPSKAARPTLPG